MRPFTHKYVVVFFDSMLASLLLLWLSGGILFNGHYFFAHGTDIRRVLIILTVIGFCFAPWSKKSVFLASLAKLKKQTPKPHIYWLLFFVAFALALAVCFFQCLALHYPLWDVGIFHQILWSLNHGFGFASTLSGAGNFLLDHLAPSLALLTPFFYLTHDAPWTTPLLHATLLFSGLAASVFLSARLRPNSDFSFAVCLFCVSSPNIWANLRWGFHENAIAFFALSWAMTLIIINIVKYRVFIALFLSIAALTKEILLPGASILLFFTGWRLVKDKYNKSGLIFGAIGIFAIFIFLYFESIDHPIGKNYFIRYYSYLGLDMKTVFINLAFKPWLVIENVGGLELLRFLGFVLLPWLGLPLLVFVLPNLKRNFTRDDLFLLIVLLASSFPSFLSMAIASYQPLRQSNFHYILELWPAGAASTVMILGRIHPKHIGQRFSLSWIFAISALFFLDPDPFTQFHRYRQESRESTSLRLLLQQLSPEDSLVGDELLGPWVAGRRHLARSSELQYLGRECPELVISRDQIQANSICPHIDKDLIWVASDWYAYRLRTGR